MAARATSAQTEIAPLTTVPAQARRNKGVSASKVDLVPLGHLAPHIAGIGANLVGELDHVEITGSALLGANGPPLVVDLAVSEVSVVVAPPRAAGVKTRGLHSRSNPSPFHRGGDLPQVFVDPGAVLLDVLVDIHHRQAIDAFAVLFDPSCQLTVGFGVSLLSQQIVEQLADGLEVVLCRVKHGVR